MTNQIAAKIKAHRAALKMTQAQYGAALDEPVSGQTISCWERGQWTPTTRHLISLSKLMGSPTEQPSLDDYASATTDQLMADAVSAATISSDALVMSAELARRYEDTDDMTQITTQAPNPQAITIDWQALVGTHQGIKGVSLRHLVSLGLYGDYRRAAEALEREPLFDTMSKSVSLPSTGGRPAEDIIITDLRSVQRFCARARTEMGGRILEVILDHHDELQAMLAGDGAALARHEQAKAPATAMSALDAFSAAVAALQEQAARTAAIEARTIEVAQQVAQIERRLDTTPIAGERSAYQVAEEAGIRSSAGRPHSSAVVSLIYDMGLAQEGLARQVTTEVNGKLADSWRIHSTGAAMIKRELARLAQRGVVLEDGRTRFEVQGRDRVFTVYR